MSLLKVLLIEKAKVRYMIPDGRSMEYAGDIKLSLEHSGRVFIRYATGLLELPSPSTWRYEAHKLKSKHVTGRVYVLTLQDGCRIQISTKIDGEADHGKALDLFFKRSRGESE